MAFRFKFDAGNKILLMRFDGRLTKESVAEFYAAIRRNALATDAKVGIWDFSGTTEWAVSAEFLRQVADLEPALPEAANHPLFIVAPTIVGLSLMRLVEIVAQGTRPRLRVVNTMDEALEALGVQSPHFEPLEDCCASWRNQNGAT